MSDTLYLVFMIQKVLIPLFFLLFTITVNAQDEPKARLLLETEILAGKLVPHAPNFPDSPISSGISLNVLKWNPSVTEGWESFYNHPQYGLSLGAHWFGNNEVLGQQYSLVPYFILPTRRDWRKGVQLRVGLGMNYFTTWYDEEKNPTNDFVGSPLTWSFQMAAHKTWFPSDKLNVRAGIVLLHASNGHTTIPNFGLNSVLASVTFQYLHQGRPSLATEKKSYKNAERHYYLLVKQSFGFHELGGAISPKGGKDYGIFHTSIAGGILFKKHILLRSGIAYRHYRSYYNYIIDNDLEAYKNTPILSASNFSIFIGCEFLMGHFSIDTELGINIYKPFYETHWEVFEQTSQFDKVAKKYIATKTGFYAHLFNTKHLPKHNVSLGAFINANFGQADFTEFSLGYTYRIK